MSKKSKPARKPATKNKGKAQRRAVGPEPVLQQMIDEALVYAEGLRAHGDEVNAQVQERLAGRLRTDSNLRGLICKERQLARAVQAAGAVAMAKQDQANNYAEANMWGYEEARMLQERAEATAAASSRHISAMREEAAEVAYSIAELTLYLEQLKQRIKDTDRHADRQYDLQMRKAQALRDEQPTVAATHRALVGRATAARTKLEREQARLAAVSKKLSTVLRTVQEQDTQTIVAEKRAAMAAAGEAAAAEARKQAYLAGEAPAGTSAGEGGE